MISEEEYQMVKSNKDSYPSYYVGFVGFHGSYGSRYWEGYSRGNATRNLIAESIRNTSKQLEAIKEIELINTDYRNIEIHNGLIYCDPPYIGTKKYSKVTPFDYDAFYDWCRKMSETNLVYISEYKMPDDFKCIWEKETTTSLDCNRIDKGNNSKVRIERLYCISSQY